MSAIVVSGDTSGAVTLDAPTVAGTVTVTLPAASGTMVVTGSSPSLANVTATGNLSVSGNTTLGDASTDTVLMTGAPSIGGAGYGMGMGFRNRIINGDMRIDQRNAGNTVNNTTANLYTLDRWAIYGTVAAKFRAAQSGMPAVNTSGFSSCIQIYSLAATTVSASDIYIAAQAIEGYNFADMLWGTASAQTCTLSFWVYSTLTGTFGGYLKGGSTYTYPFTYTVSSANTWTKATVTIPGQTAGTWNTTTSAGVYVGFSFGTGSTYVAAANSWTGGDYYGATGQTQFVSTSAAVMYITGVQLEKGSTATSFDYRDYGRELVLCQRYFQKYAGQPSAYLGNGNNARNGYLTSFIYPVKMRTAPTASNITGFAAGNATSYAFSSPSMVTTVDGLYEIFGASATSLNYSEPFCVFFTTLDLSAEL